MNLQGKQRRFGFFQTVYVESPDTRQAELDAVEWVRNNDELKELALNKPGDAPMLLLSEMFELDAGELMPEQREGRSYYVNKSWWQFWR